MAGYGTGWDEDAQNLQRLVVTQESRTIARNVDDPPGRLAAVLSTSAVHQKPTCRRKLPVVLSTPS